MAENRRALFSRQAGEMARNEQSDEALMGAYQDGDLDAFETLYRRYAPRVRAYLRKRIPDQEGVEEVFQGIFLKLHRSRLLYDPKYRFAPWLFTICRHYVIDAARTKKIFGEAPLPLDEGKVAAPQPEAEPEADLILLDGLEKGQRDVIEMRYRQEMSFSQIAEELQLTEVAVRKRLSRAVKTLRKKLKPSVSERK